MVVGAYLRSSIGKKQMMAITGLLWCGFVAGHMAGNLLFLVGPEAFNAYGHAITSNKPIYYTIEAILASTILLHIFFAVQVVLDNRRAKPVGYAVNPKGNEKGAVSFAAQTMKYSGAVILLFVVLHLITFRFGVYYPFAHKGEDIRDLYRLMEEVFASAAYVGFYLACLLLLAFHLSHALWSSIQTLGLIPDGKEAKLRCASLAFGWVVALGFAVNPIIIFIRG